MDWRMTLQAFSDAFDGLMLFIPVYGLLLLFFLFFGTKEEKRVFVYPVVFLCLTLYNPLLVAPIADKIGLAARIRRIYWLLPVVLLLAYGLVRVFDRLHSKVLKSFFLVLCFLFIAYAGQDMRTAFAPVENEYKISDEIIALDDMLNEDGGTETKRAAYADLRLLELRQYDPSVRNVITRNRLLYWNPDLSSVEAVEDCLTEANATEILTLVLRFDQLIDPEIFQGALAEKEVSYVIIEENADKAAYLEKCGMEILNRTESFLLYKASRPVSP